MSSIVTMDSGTGYRISYIKDLPMPYYVWKPGTLLFWEPPRPKHFDNLQDALITYKAIVDGRSVENGTS